MFIISLYFQFLSIVERKVNVMKKIFCVLFTIQVIVAGVISLDAESDAVVPTMSTTPAPLLKNPSQCLYDNMHHRVNRDCHVEVPPTCEKGDLVVTQIGEKYEMCCCNYSNYLVDE